MPTALSTIVPGCTYDGSTHVWTIPASSLATSSGITWSSPVDSASALVYMMLQSLYTYQNENSSYSADSDLFSCSSRNVSSYGWGNSATGLNSTIITHTFSAPFVSEVGQISPDAMGEN